MSNIYLERLRSISRPTAVQEPPKLPKGEAIHGKPPVQGLPKVSKGAFGSFGSATTSGIPENELLTTPADTGAAAQAAARLLARAAHPSRDDFALRNHTESIRHFRRVAEEAERLAAMYRSKIDAHVDAARQRLGNTAEFDEWLGKI